MFICKYLQVFSSQNNNPTCQSYSQTYAAEVEVWNTADEFTQSIQHKGTQPKFIKEHNGKYITFDYWEGNIDKQVFDQILSTFKFLD